MEWTSWFGKHPIWAFPSDLFSVYRIFAMKTVNTGLMATETGGELLRKSVEINGYEKIPAFKSALRRRRA